MYVPPNNPKIINPSLFHFIRILTLKYSNLTNLYQITGWVLGGVLDESAIMFGAFKLKLLLQ